MMKLQTKLTILFITGMTLLTIGMLAGIAHAETMIDRGAVMDGVNKVRMDKGLHPLVTNTKLEQAAVARANNMCQNGYFEHTDEQGRRFFYYVDQADYDYDKTAENIARGYETSQQVVDAWVSSPSHYSAMINPVYSETGVAVVTCPNFLGWQNAPISVQLFGTPPANDRQWASPILLILVVALLAIMFGLGALTLRIKR